MNINGCLSFKGEFDPNKEYRFGDIIIDGSDTFVATGITKGIPPIPAGFPGGPCEWKRLCKISENSYNENDYIPKPRICKCCSAPLPINSLTCEYCGVTYSDRLSFLNII